jgi:hypothetical protein
MGSLFAMNQSLPTCTLGHLTKRAKRGSVESKEPAEMIRGFCCDGML